MQNEYLLLKIDFQSGIFILDNFSFVQDKQELKNSMTARFGKTTYFIQTTKIAHNYIVVKQLHNQDITTYLRNNYKFTKNYIVC